MTSPAASRSFPTRIGDFVVTGVLGEGGSGIVYDARWGHRQIALKVLHPVLVATAKERDQFLAEARRLAEIHHAGVVKVLAVGETPDSDGARPFLAMEKLHGETLANRLSRGPLPVTLALELFGQLCDAVEAFHGRGLVHRDLKPENVVLVEGADERAHAVLLDFGIAKELASAPSTTTQEGGVRGTPAYMAPERFFGQPASVSTDVYELAVTLFAMLAGRLPWDDVGDPEVRLDPKRLAEVAPQVPAALDLEVRRALSTRAQNRPAGAAELRSAVMGAAGMEWAPRATVDVKSGPIRLNELAHAPTQAPVPVSTRVGRVRTRKGPIVAGVVGLVAIASGIGIAAHFLSAPGKKIESSDPPGPAPEKVAAKEVAPEPDDPIPPADLEAARRSLVAALAHLPDDVLFAFGAQVAELENDSTLQPVIGLFADSSPGKLLRAEANLGSCELDVRDRADWIVFAGPADESAVDLIVGGRWSREQFERCLETALRATTVTRDGRFTSFTGGAVDRVAGWLDDHSVFISSRPGADQAWLAARLDDTTPPGGVLGAALAEIDPTAAIWFAGDEAGKRGASLTGDTEMEGMWGHLDADGSRVVLDLKVRYPNAKLADQARADLNAQVGDLGLDESMGHIKIDADPERPDVLRVDIAMMRMIAGALLQQAAISGFAP